MAALFGSLKTASTVGRGARKRAVSRVFPTLEGLEGRQLLATTLAPGSLDPTFGTAGVVQSGFSSGSSGATAVAIQPADQKIVVVGWTDPSTVDTSLEQWTVARYNPDGSLDTTFGQGGRVITPDSTPSYRGTQSNLPTTVVVQPDGKILVGGIWDYDSGSSIGAVIRYNADGSLDTTFGDGGEELAVPGLATVTGLALDGNEIAVDGQHDGNVTRGFVVDLLKADGSPDTAFGQSGMVAGNFSPNSLDETNAVAVGNGLIYAAGATLSPAAPNGHLAVVALSPTGAIVAQATVNFNNGTLGSGALGLAIQPGDGKVIAVGFDDVHTSSNPLVTRGALVRFNSDLTQDTSFGNNGIVSADSGPGADAVENLVVQADGKIVTVTSSFEVVRYNPDGSRDNTFGTDGVVTLPPPLQGQSLTAGTVVLALQGDGNLVAAGTFATSPNSSGVLTLARYVGSPTTAAEAPPPVTSSTPDPTSSPSTSTSGATPGSQPVTPSGATPGSQPGPAIAVDGPHVISVVRHGHRARRTTLVIRFDTAMSPVSADKVSNYRITGRHGHVIRVVKASYNSATDSVRIRPGRRFNVHRNYVLTVSGTGPFGLRSASGTLLDGLSNGKPGSNYVTRLRAAHRHVFKPRST